MSVDVAAILDDLARDRHEHLRAFTTTMNVVVVVEDAAIYEWIEQRVDEIAQKHPSRALVLDGTRAEGTYAIESNRSEHVDLGIAKMPAEELRSVVRALLVPNVQTTLLWACDRTASDPRFEALLGLADRAIVDSSRHAATAEPLRELIRYVEGTEDAAVHDLAYMRLLPWQDMIAQFFDDTELANELAAIGDVRIGAGSQAEAYYLLGWLGSRLHWQPCDKDAFCNAEGETVHFGVEAEGSPRRVARVTLRSAHATFDARLQPNAPDLVCLTVEGTRRRPQRCAPLHHVEIVTLIERAMLDADDASVYRESLGVARALLDMQRSTV